MNTNLYIRVSGQMGDEARTEIDEHFKALRGVMLFGWRDAPESGADAVTVSGCVYGKMRREMMQTIGETMRLVMGRWDFVRMALRVALTPAAELEEAAREAKG